ncbi:MAG: hypothetical protein ACXAEU_19110 [Candidatus Hodarchaeales archaeon]
MELFRCSDWKKAQRVKAQSPEELSTIEKGEFKSRSEWLVARKAGVNTLKEYQEYLNLQIYLTKLKTDAWLFLVEACIAL